MLRLAVRGLRAHLARLLLTVIVVLMGVAFISGGQVLTNTIRVSFDKVFTDVYSGTDVIVRSSDVAWAAFQQNRAPVDAETLQTVRGVDGVRLAEPVVQRPIHTLDADGERVCNIGGGPPILGLNWIADPILSQWRIVEGTAPTEPDEVVLDPEMAADQGFEVGDEITIPVASGTRVFTVSGIAAFSTTGDYANASAVLFPTPVAQELLVAEGSSDWITVSAIDGVSEEELATRIRSALPPAEKLQTITGTTFSQQTRDFFGGIFDSFNQILTVFGIVALFVAIFVIYNTFSLLVAQRSRELALLRAIGASRLQIIGSTLTEALLVGLIASLAGIATGIALGWAITGFLTNAGFVPPDAPLEIRLLGFWLPLLVGVSVTMAAAMFPAWRASRIAPVAAMREAAHDVVRTSGRRLVVGSAVTTYGLILLLLGLFDAAEGVRSVLLPVWGDDRLASVGIGMGAIFGGIAVLATVFVGPVSGAVGAPLARWGGATGRLAQANAARNPRRSAATASAVMVGVALVTFIAIIGESLRVATIEAIDATISADFVIDARCGGLTGVNPALATELGELDGVENVAGFRAGIAKINGRNQAVVGTDVTALDEVLDLEVAQGDLASIDTGHIAVSSELADRLDLDVDSPVRLDFIGIGRTPSVVGAVYDSALLRGVGVMISTQLFEESFPEVFQTDLQLYVNLADPVDRPAAVAEINEVVDRYPPAAFQDIVEFTETQTAPIERAVFFVWALLLLAVVISVIGVLNTMLLSVYERTRELGLLRAAGTSRRQVRASVRSEAIVITLIGTVLGLAVGVFFGWSIIQALSDEGFDVFAIPWIQVGVIVAVAWVAGLLAAFWPARRAASLDVLDAIAHE